MISSLWSKLALIAVFLMVSSSPCWADGYLAKSSKKFVTGFTNVATCWLEIPLRVCDRFRESENAAYGACLAPTLGVLEGNTLVLGRLAGGIADMTTFMVPWPYGNFEPIMKPIWKREPRDPGLDIGI